MYTHENPYPSSLFNLTIFIPFHLKTFKPHNSPFNFITPSSVLITRGSNITLNGIGRVLADFVNASSSMEDEG